MKTPRSGWLFFAALSLACILQSRAATLIDVAFTSAAVTPKTGFAATGLSTNDFWNTYVLSSEILPNLKFVDDTPSGATMNVVNDQGVYANGALDPMYGAYLYCTSYESITVTITNLISGAYDLYLYGHGNGDNQNSVFDVTAGSQSYGAEATTNGSGWLSSVWEEGVQYVEFTNVSVVAGQAITITINPGGSAFAVLSGLQVAMGVPRSNGPPFILSQPGDQTVIYGTSATFSVLALAGGSSPLTYQWYFDNGSISGATNSSYAVTNAQVANAGSYSVVVTNADGSVGSAIVLLNVIALPIINTQPISQEIVQGSNAIFDVEAVGPVALAYQWFFNDSSISEATNSAYSVPGAQLTNGGDYSVIVSDAYGSVTSAVASLTVVTPPLALIDVAFMGTAMTAKSGFAAIGVASNDFWNTYDVVTTTDLPNLKYTDGTLSSTGLAETGVYSVGANGSSDPMYGDFAYASGNITLAITNLPTGSYDFYLYGHGGEDNENSAFQLSVDSLDYGSAATTNGTGWLSSVWLEGVQYVEFEAVSVSAGQAVTITVEPGAAGVAALSGLQMAYVSATPSGPFIVNQPTDQTAFQTLTVAFNVLAGGAEPLAYQWLFNGTNIQGATHSNYSLTNSQPANAGDYAVIVTNLYGSVTSAVATLQILMPVFNILDVAFTGVSATSKAGFAAVGITAADYWNTYNVNSGPLTDLKFVGGIASGAGLSEENVYAVADNGSTDPMYGVYAYASPSQDIVLTLTNLIAGTYDFYLYGHGNADIYNSSFQLTVGSEDYGTYETMIGPGWLSSAWEEGAQYIEFGGVYVPTGQTVIITVGPGYGDIAAISGLQMVYSEATPAPPEIITQPEDQTVHQYTPATFTVLPGGAAPLAFQWLFNNEAIPNATNSIYSLSNIQPNNAGGYSVIVANNYGSITSSVAQLNLFPPGPTLIDVAFTDAATTTKTGFAATGLTSNDFWNTRSLTYPHGPGADFTDGTSSGADVILSNGNLQWGYGENGASDPMYGNAVYPLNGGDPVGSDFVEVSNLIASAYDFYLYGHGSQDAQNSVFHLNVGSDDDGAKATINGPGWLSPIWSEGVQYVEFTNISVSAGQSVLITVEAGAGEFAVLSGLQIESVAPASSTPFIRAQSMSQTVVPGSSVTLSVSAGGAPPLAYQWLLNNLDISGATNFSYSIANTQFTNAGDYSVIATNSFGSLTSTVVALNVVAPVSNVIDLDITSPTSSKTGFAATGVSSNDYWNAFPPNSGVLTNMEFMDGTPSGAGITVPYGLQTSSNGASDPMYGFYVYAGGENIPVIITNLAPGAYDFYLYGHGNANSYNSIFQLGVSSLIYGDEATTNGPDWLSSTWREGVQYVEFTNVSVNTNQTVTITVEPGVGGYAVLSGLQIVPVGPPSPRASIVTEPINEISVESSNATFSVVAEGGAPLQFQWSFNGSAIAGATNSDYVVTNAQLTSDGNYSVIVSNSYGNVTSLVATLTVTRAYGALIDLAFAEATVTGKTGFAATGVANDDYWNTFSSLSDGFSNYRIGSYPNNIYWSLTNLLFSDGVVSGVDMNVTMIDFPVSGTNGASDPMYGVYLYGVFAGGGYMEVANLSPGLYDFYLYGHGSQDDENTVYQLSAGAQSYGSEATVNGPALEDLEYYGWEEGVQYVKFANVSVSNGQSVSISFYPDATQYFGVISGLQIAYVGQAAIVTQPADQPAILGSTATFSVGAIGASPLAYQWLFDSTLISGATDQSLTVTNAQANNVGDYFVTVSNAYGSVTSAVAALTFVYVPTITNPPASQLVFQSSNANFGVGVIGGTPLAYQWMFNNTPIPAATDATYSVTNAQSNNAGNYSVIISNGYGSVTSAVATLNVRQPILELVDVAFTGASLTGKSGFAATGLTSNDFWNTYVANSPGLPGLLFVDGTVSGAVLSVTNTQGSSQQFSANGASDPMYGVFLSEYAGAIGINISNLVAGTYDFYLYGDGSIFYLNAGSRSYGSEATTNEEDWLSPIWQEGAQYAEFTNVLVATGQPIFITVGGSTAISGMQVALVDMPSSNAFINTQPTNQTVLYNSAATFSVLAGGTALAYQWLFDGVAISAATNSAYTVANAISNDAGSYSVIVINAYGTATSTVVALTVEHLFATMIDVAFTSSSATAKTGFAAEGLYTNDIWNTCTGHNEFLNYSDGAASGAEIFVSNSAGEFSQYSNGASDPMYGIYVYDAPGTNFSVTVTNLPEGAYDIYCYGHGHTDNQDGVYQLIVGSQDYGIQQTTTNDDWLSLSWQDSVQYVVFTNVAVTESQAISLVVQPGGSGYAILSGVQIALRGSPPPEIVTQPPNQSIVSGGTATFAVVAGGSLPLAYQWQFNGVDIAGGINSGYNVTNVETSNIGSYTVIVTNTYGSVTSSIASLTIRPIVNLIDVAFTGAAMTTKTGFAATGLTSNDFWNTYVMNSGPLLDLKLADGTISGINLAVADVAGYNGNGASDPMYDAYLYSPAHESITVTISNLIAGSYDFYFYGHGNVDSENSLFELTAGSTSYGGQPTINGPGWLSPVWEEGVQYVEFSYVNVLPGQTITVTAAPDGSSDAVISGLQIAAASPPFIITQPANQTVLQGTTATFSVVAIGGLPLAFQWRLDNTNNFAATNNTLIVTNVQPADAGLYSVVVTNEYGSITSAVVTLTVVTPLVTDIAYNGDATITLNLETLPNASVRIWTATNLAPPIIWTPIFTNGNTGATGQWQFTDTNTANYEERFYRFSIP